MSCLELVVRNAMSMAKASCAPGVRFEYYLTMDEYARRRSIKDPNLKFLAKCSSNDLSPLVSVITLEGGVTCDLYCYDESGKTDYREHLGAICDELRKFGSNTLATLFRGGKGVPYREIVRDVADKVDVAYSGTDSVEVIEKGIVEKIFVEACKNMTAEQCAEFMTGSGYESYAVGGVSSAAVIELFRQGGFSSYKIAVIVANALAQQFLGHGLSLAMNAGLTKALSILAGPIGIAISALWTAIDIAGPAYRVTVPAVAYIGALRSIKQSAV